MRAVKRICAASAVISLTAVLCMAGLPYERMVIVPPLATGGIAVIFLLIAAAAVTVPAVMYVRSDVSKKRKVLRIVLTALAGIVLLFFALISSWLFGGSTVDKVIDSPDGRYRVVMILDSDVLGNPIYRFYAGKRHGIVFDRVINAASDDPEIVWADGSVAIGREQYRF
ncbi:MAG: hypothetical protein IJM44_08205 [Ruminococcus sp.]|nr:hypothetical protein [Ruminococcus sp.]